MDFSESRAESAPHQQKSPQQCREHPAMQGALSALSRGSWRGRKGMLLFCTKTFDLQLQVYWENLYRGTWRGLQAREGHTSRSPSADSGLLSSTGGECPAVQGVSSQQCRRGSAQTEEGSAVQRRDPCMCTYFQAHRS
eukprot:1152907-Pelagomonas_calceolata.AAC.2